MAKVPTANELIRCAVTRVKSKQLKNDIRRSEVIRKAAVKFVREHREVFIKHGEVARDQACNFLAELAAEARLRHTKK